MLQARKRVVFARKKIKSSDSQGLRIVAPPQAAVRQAEAFCSEGALRLNERMERTLRGSAESLTAQPEPPKLSLKVTREIL